MNLHCHKFQKILLVLLLTLSWLGFGLLLVHSNHLTWKQGFKDGWYQYATTRDQFSREMVCANYWIGMRGEMEEDRNNHHPKILDLWNE